MPMSLLGDHVASMLSSICFVLFEVDGFMMVLGVGKEKSRKEKDGKKYAVEGRKTLKLREYIWV